MPMPKLLSRSILFVPALFLTSLLTAGAQEKERPLTPKTLRGGDIVSAPAAKKLLDERKAEFFDVRSAAEFSQGRIPRASLLPCKVNSAHAVDFDPSADQFDLGNLPPNKGTTVVFYCDGPNGWNSYKAAVVAIKAGYRDVVWLREGISGWRVAEYPVE